MVKEYSPFTPGVPVPLEFFIGREKEIKEILSRIKKANDLGTIERLFIVGERGIGKSSIGRFALTAAEQHYGIIGLHIYLGGVTTLEELVRRVFDRLIRVSATKPWYKKVVGFLGDHVKKVDMFGVAVEFSASKDELTRAVNDFIPALRKLLKELAPERIGILLILDDFNGLAGSERFAGWMKSLIDELATSNEPLPLTLILVGLPERRKQLLAAQQSLDRAFDLVTINRFDESETRAFFVKTFGKVNIEVDPGALKLLVRISGGYPVFMHELGDAVFREDEDNRIDSSDAKKGIIQGVNILGEKYIEPKILDEVRSEKYRNLLEKISKVKLGESFLRSDIVAKLNMDESKVLDNFLRRMEKLGAIEKDIAHGPGSYKFINELYHLYIRRHFRPYD